MSIQLVLSHYLAGLRERNELDALLPELLKAMGHSVLSRPQIGPAQAGVDVLSTRKNPEGITEVYVFIIKFGDLGRADFYGGQQSIDPSVREACTDFLRNRLPAHLKSLSKRIILVSNGVLLQEAQAGFSALTEDVAERPLCRLEFWGSDQLTPLIEQFLFDETLLLAKGKSDLRAALAGIEESDAAIGRFIRFIDACFEYSDKEMKQSEPTRKKKFLRRCAAASMGWAVLLVWGKSEGNLKPGAVTGEYLILRMWAEAVKLQWDSDRAFITRLETLADLHTQYLVDYFEKVMPALETPRAVLSYRPNRIFYLDLLFEELGRLATLQLLLQRKSGHEALKTRLHQAIINLINQHPGALLPVYDGQAIDLTLLFCALMGQSDWNNAQVLTRGCVNRLIHALRAERYLPVDTDSLEDAVSIDKGQAKSRDYFQTSTLVPALATVAALLNDEEALELLRSEVLPLMKGVTLERWYPYPALETLTGSLMAVQSVGISKALSGIRLSAKEEAEASIKNVENTPSASDFRWSAQWQVLIALSARLHRHPLPTWLIAKYRRPESLD